MGAWRVVLSAMTRDVARRSDAVARLFLKRDRMNCPAFTAHGWQ